MKKTFAYLLVAILIFSSPAWAAPTLVTVADKSTGQTLSAAEFTQILDALKSGTRTIKPQSVIINGVQGFFASGLEGTATGDLATIATSSIQDGAIGIVAVPGGSSYQYSFDADGTDAEAVPTVIRPNDYSSAGVWKLVPMSVAMLPAAGESSSGVVELATTTEVVTGTDTARAVTPAGVTARLAAPGTIGDTTPGAGYFTEVYAGGAAFHVDADGDTTAKSYSVSPVDGVGGDMWVYDAELIADKMTFGFRSHPNLTSHYRLLYPPAVPNPAANDYVLYGFPAAASGDGTTAATAYLSQGVAITLNDDAGNNDTTSLWSADKIYDQLALKLSLSVYNANTILAANSDDTPAALEITEQTVVGRVTSGNIAALAIDSDLGAVASTHTTLPSAKAVKEKIQYKSWSFDPKAVCDGAVDRLFLMSAHGGQGVKITAWKVSFEANPTTEADLDLKRADAWIGVANAAVMDVLDTTDGAASESTAANINSDAAVAEGKVIYLEFGTAYTEENHQIIFEMWFYEVGNS